MNVLHTDRKLTLVFEYLDQDLKKLLDTCQAPLDDLQVKVSYQLKHIVDSTIFITSVLLIEIPLSVAQRYRKMSPSQSSASRSQASKSTDQSWGSPQTGWFWLGSRLWNSCQKLHPWGCDSLVSCARYPPWEQKLYNFGRYLVSRMHLRRNSEQIATFRRSERCRSAQQNFLNQRYPTVGWMARFDRAASLWVAYG